jgi:octaprenyl-diphosphate synthase
VGSNDDAATIRHAIEGGGRLTDFGPVLRVLERTGALAYARDRAADEGRRAAACVAGVPASPYSRSLLDLAAFAANRAF